MSVLDAVEEERAVRAVGEEEVVDEDVGRAGLRCDSPEKISHISQESHISGE